jgi:hypothetical protein
MAEVILYGLSLGIRSSRKLEDACINRIDFLWITQGRSIDHSTLAGFRVGFAKELKEMFRQIGRVAIGLGMVNLNQVSLDGTVKRASNSRQAVGRKVSLEQKLAALDQQVQSLMSEALATDQKENELFGASSPAKLPRELGDLKARRQRLSAALKKVLALEAKRKPADKNTGDSKASGPAVPITDPDANLMKNKTGGFAPNHLVVLATEGKNGFVVDYQVPANPDEPSSVMPAVNNLRESFGQQCVGELLADAGFNSGSNLAALESAGIEPWMPAKKPAVALDSIAADNTTDRAMPNVTPDANTPSGPAKSRGKTLDKSLFLYQPADNVYLCPANRSLPFWKNDSEKNNGGSAKIRIYQSTDCGNCPLAGQCIANHNKGKLRTIRRDQHEPLREQMAARMATEQGKSKYRRRSFLSETPFAVFNTTMNVMRLLLRGTEKVTAEIGWICSAYNLKKLTRLIAASREAEMTPTA